MMSQGNMVSDQVSGMPQTDGLSPATTPVVMNLHTGPTQENEIAIESKSPSVSVSFPVREGEPQRDTSMCFSQGTVESEDGRTYDVSIDRDTEYVHRRAKEDGWRSMRKQATFLGRMVGPVIIISLVMFGMFSLLSWSIPHVLCETYSKELSVRFHVSEMLVRYLRCIRCLACRVLQLGYMNVCTTLMATIAVSIPRKYFGLYFGQYKRVGSLCFPGILLMHFLVR